MIESLTDDQRACLRLVLEHRSSKEIAMALGVSPHTVDQRIKVAMRKLGASSRAEAARMLALAERGDVQPLVYQPPDIANPLPQPQAGPVGATAAPPAEGGWRVVPTTDRPANSLSGGQRLLVIVLVAIGSALGFGAILAGLSALTELVRK